MIVSFLYDSKNADEHIDFIYRDDGATFKEPLYHKSVKQLSKLHDIKGIIIPGQRNVNEPINYYPGILIEHIRLLKDTNLSSLPIFVVNAPEDLIDKLEVHLDYGIDILPNEDIDFGNVKKLTDSKLKRLITHIANNHDGKSRHNQSNEWGSYRLESALIYLIPGKKDLSSIKESLSESNYYKKLLLKESYQNEYILNSTQNGDVLNKLSFINNNAKRVAIIDDMIDIGWKEAYLKIFHQSEVECFDQDMNVFQPENSMNYDLIILDLRLIEEVQENSNDDLGIEDLSGMRLLKEIKRQDPSVPVIISTASNKSWSLKSALNNGADGYWSKEDPNRDLSFEFRFENTFSFLQTIHDALEWSKKTRCIYKALIEIYNDLSKTSPFVAKSLLKKTDIIYGQLHASQTSFTKHFFGQSGLEVSFITISSFINEIMTLYKKTDKDEKNKELYYLVTNEEEYLFCYLDDNSKFIIPDEIINELSTDRYTPHQTNSLFPEKPFMQLLLEKLEMKNLRSRYGYYSSIRNKIDIIHGKPIIENIDLNFHKVTIDDLYELLKIFYQAFLQKPCELLPINKRYYKHKNYKG